MVHVKGASGKASITGSEVIVIPSSDFDLYDADEDLDSEHETYSEQEAHSENESKSRRALLI